MFYMPWFGVYMPKKDQRILIKMQIDMLKSFIKGNPPLRDIY